MLSVVLLTSSVVFAQKSKNKLPQDLKTEKLILLQYEELPIESYYPKMVKNRYEVFNVVIKRTNPKLVKEAKKYPFEYTISQRAKYEELKDQGYKYVLECDMMEEMNNGTFTPGTNVRYFSDVYILDMETKKKYVLFDISQSDLFDYKEIITKLNKLVKKQFGVSSN